MIGLNFRSLTFMLFIFCLTWSSHIHTCKARRGKHWRHRRGSSVSLYNRNGKNHGSSNHQSNVGKMISPPTPEHRAPPSLQKATTPPPYPNTLSPPPTPPPQSTPLLSPNAPPPPPYPNVPPPPQSPNAPPPSPNMPQPPPSLSTSPSPPYPNTPPQLQIPNAPPPPPSLNALPPPSYPNTPTPPQPPYPHAPLPLPYSNAPPPPPPPSLTAPSPLSYPNAPPPPSPNASKPPPSPNAPPPPNAPTRPPPSPNVPPPPPSLNAPPPPSYPNTPPPSPYPNAPQPPPSPNAPPPPPYPNTPPAPPPASPNEPPPPSYLNTPPPPPSRNAPQPPPPPNALPPPPPLPPPPSPIPPPQPPPSSPKPPPLPTSVKLPPLSKAPPPKAPPPPPSPKPPPPPKAPPPSLKAPKPSVPQPSIVFDVLKFGARGDGASDDTKAFQSAWAAACKVEASTIMVPSEFTFLVGPISFAGPNCQPNIIFQLDGTIIAPTSSKPWGSGLLQWIEFTKLKGITVQGSGTIDGRGSVWWKESPYAAPPDKESRLAIPLNKISSNSLGGKMPSTKPTALRFYGSSNAIVKGITIQNSPLCHLKFDNCLGVSVFDISISSPGDSPNTDGIHLQNSQNVLIRSTNLSCGDDCVSIQTGCSNVDIHNVNCGPGHGISIGGLGKDQTKACVSNITVRDTNMHNTLTGVRIKTWQGGSGSVQGVLFSNIQVSEVEIPIVIDQYYCHSSKCKNQTSAVALSDIRYEKISGTYTVQPAYLACSDSIPCVDVILSDIGLNPLQQKYRMDDAFCWKTFGESKAPVEPPIHCIQHRKQSRNWIQKDQYSCQA